MNKKTLKKLQRNVLVEMIACDLCGRYAEKYVHLKVYQQYARIDRHLHICDPCLYSLIRAVKRGSLGDRRWS